MQPHAQDGAAEQASVHCACGLGRAARRLDYIAVSPGPADIHALLSSYANGSTQLTALIAALDARPP